MSNNRGSDKYERIAREMERKYQSRDARRKRKAKVNHTPKKSEEEILEEIADRTAVEGGFNITYTPARYEEEFLQDSIVGFFHQALITDVLAQVKGGKEATVYRCEAHESTGVDYLAVKVYRPRKFRNLRNDKMYREGRSLIGIDGKEVDDRDLRAMRAIRAGSSFGEQLSHTSWLMHEFVMLQRLYDAGASVPKPYASGENALVMSYVGDGMSAAPTLHEVKLDDSEVEHIYATVMRNIDLLARCGVAHGDLSAYNVLYWGGDITFIDFPQVTDLRSNPHAHDILSRDVQRIGEYFEPYGITTDVDKIVRRIWRKYGPDGLSPEEIASMHAETDET